MTSLTVDDDVVELVVALVVDFVIGFQQVSSGLLLLYDASVLHNALRLVVPDVERVQLHHRP